MPSASRIIICAAGGGKTTRIVNESVIETGRSLLVTYTRNNEAEIQRKLYEHGPVIPSNIEVATWFSFLLRELARPYRPAMHDKRIDGLHWEEGRSARYIPQTNIAGHYFAGDRYIYSDKIAKFVCECDKRTSGAVIQRLMARFDHIFIDEMQDMAGYDLDIIEAILKTSIKLTVVGDHRQATFKTNQSGRNSGFAGINIIKKFRAWEKAGLANVAYEQHTHRCHQDIATLGDSLFPSEPPTTSLNSQITGHDGIFIVGKNKVDSYVAAFKPQVLRFDRKTPCGDLPAMNFGEAKGLTFDRVLIFPHGLAKKWLNTGSLIHIEKSLPRMYVGTTRARHSLAFVHDGTTAIAGAQTY